MASKENLYKHPQWPDLCTKTIMNHKDDLENISMIDGVLRSYAVETGNSLSVSPWAFIHNITYGAMGVAHQLLWKVPGYEPFPGSHSVDFRGEAGCRKTSLWFMLKGILDKSCHRFADFMHYIYAVPIQTVYSMKNEWMSEISARDPEADKTSKKRKRKYSSITDWIDSTMTEEEKIQNEEEWREKEMNDAQKKSKIVNIYVFDQQTLIIRSTIARKVPSNNGWRIMAASNQRKQMELVLLEGAGGIVFYPEVGNIQETWPPNQYKNFVLKMGESCLEGMCYTGSHFSIKDKESNWAIVVTGGTWGDLAETVDGIVSGAFSRKMMIPLYPKFTGAAVKACREKSESKTDHDGNGHDEDEKQKNIAMETLVNLLTLIQGVSAVEYTISDEDRELFALRAGETMDWDKFREGGILASVEMDEGNLMSNNTDLFELNDGCIDEEHIGHILNIFECSDVSNNINNCNDNQCVPVVKDQSTKPAVTCQEVEPFTASNISLISVDSSHSVNVSSATCPERTFQRNLHFIDDGKDFRKSVRLKTRRDLREQSLSKKHSSYINNIRHQNNNNNDNNGDNNNNILHINNDNDDNNNKQSVIHSDDICASNATYSQLSSMFITDNEEKMKYFNEIANLLTELDDKYRGTYRKLIGFKMNIREKRFVLYLKPWSLWGNGNVTDNLSVEDIIAVHHWRVCDILGSKSAAVPISDQHGIVIWGFLDAIQDKPGTVPVLHPDWIPAACFAVFRQKPYLTQRLVRKGMDVAMIWSLIQTLTELGVKDLKEWAMEKMQPLFVCQSMFIRKEAMNNAARCIIFTLCMNAEIFDLPKKMGCNLQGFRQKYSDFTDLLNSDINLSVDNMSWSMKGDVSGSSHINTTTSVSGNSFMTASSNIISKTDRIQKKVDPITGLKYQTGRSAFPINDECISYTVFLFYRGNDYETRFEYVLGVKSWLKTHANTSAGVKLYKWAFNNLYTLGLIAGYPPSDTKRYQKPWIPQIIHKIPTSNMDSLRDVLSKCINAEWNKIRSHRRTQVAGLNASYDTYLQTLIFYYPCLESIKLSGFVDWISGSKTCEQLYNEYNINIDDAEKEIFVAN